jgi:hypothetical protein
LEIVPSRQLVAPTTVKLRASEALRLTGRDAFDQATVNKGELVQGFVVVFDQYARDNRQKARVALEAG